MSKPGTPHIQNAVRVLAGAIGPEVRRIQGAWLYLMRVEARDGQDLWKVGVTNYADPAKRANQWVKRGLRVELHECCHYSLRADALAAERRTINKAIASGIEQPGKSLAAEILDHPKAAGWSETFMSKPALALH